MNHIIIITGLPDHFVILIVHSGMFDGGNHINTNIPGRRLSILTVICYAQSSKDLHSVEWQKLSHFGIFTPSSGRNSVISGSSLRRVAETQSYREVEKIDVKLSVRLGHYGISFMSQRDHLANFMQNSIN